MVGSSDACAICFFIHMAYIEKLLIWTPGTCKVWHGYTAGREIQHRTHTHKNRTCNGYGYILYCKCYGVVWNPQYHQYPQVHTAPSPPFNLVKVAHTSIDVWHAFCKVMWVVGGLGRQRRGAAYCSDGWVLLLHDSGAVVKSLLLLLALLSLSHSLWWFLSLSLLWFLLPIPFLLPLLLPLPLPILLLTLICTCLLSYGCTPTVVCIASVQLHPPAHLHTHLHLHLHLPALICARHSLPSLLVRTRSYWPLSFVRTGSHLHQFCCSCPPFLPFICSFVLVHAHSCPSLPPLSSSLLPPSWAITWYLYQIDG